MTNQSHTHDPSDPDDFGDLDPDRLEAALRACFDYDIINHSTPHLAQERRSVATIIRAYLAEPPVPDLKPCFGCGSQDDLEPVDSDDFLSPYKVQCCNCRTSGPACPTEREAAKRWNAISSAVAAIRRVP